MLQPDSNQRQRLRNHKADTFPAVVSTVGAEAMLDTSFGVLFQNTGRTAPSRRSPWSRRAAIGECSPVEGR